MSSRSKKLVSVLCCLLLLTLVGTAGGALLSPAMPSLEKQITLQKCGVAGRNIRFSAADFDDTLHTKPEFIRVDTLPDAATGTLMLGIAPICENQLIARNDFNQIVFIPADSSVGSAAFTFSNATAKQSDVAVSCTMNLLEEVNLAPSVGSQTITTGESISAFKFLKAADPENDAMRFEIITYPAHGAVHISENANGYFCYTPQKKFVGSDSFEYAAVDCYGNKSMPTKVNIHVTKTAYDVDYDDMNDHWAHNSAVNVSAWGLMTGVTDTETGNYLFMPEETVSRGDFLAMALIAAGKEANIEFTAQTSFDDDADIPVNIKSYAEYAKTNGIVSGYTDENGNCRFASTTPITRSEAAVILDRILALPENSEKSDAVSTFIDCSAIPAWANQALVKVASCGIFNGTGFGEILPEDTVTRAETAEILCNMQNYLAETFRPEKAQKSRNLFNLFGLIG